MDMMVTEPVNTADLTPSEHVRQRIRFFSERLVVATRELETATPNSNHQKKARAEIVKCKKKIIKLQKELKAIT